MSTSNGKASFVPNVVILMSDEHNHRVSSVYGHSRVETPNMERLARDGVVHDAAYCPSPLCAPSRSSFLAGLPAHETQVYNNCTVVQFDYPTYGSVLKDQGVHSVHIGKTDAYNRAETLGFSETRLPGDRASPGDINFCRNPLTVRDDGPKRAGGYGPKVDAFAKDERVIDEAIAWLSSEAPALTTPWTLTVNILAPHFPHYATPDLWDKYQDAADLPRYGAESDSANHPYAMDLRQHFQTDAFTEAQIRGLRQGYLACVDFADAQLGRLLDTLETTGLRDDTIVIYTSDHGEMLGKFGMWWKSSMYEDSVRVPLIVSGPGFPSGQRVPTPVTLLDVQATLFRATGATRPAAWWGDPLQDIPANDDRIAFAEYHGHGTRSGTFMVRKGVWKLLHHAAAPHQLFDLARDPEELVNRYADEPAIASELEHELRRLCSPEAEFERAHAFERHQLEQLKSINA
jgi:choline-sulfatase